MIAFSSLITTVIYNLQIHGKVNKYQRINNSERDEMANRKTLSHHEYTVGWICAIDTELVAAMAMLDERHNSLTNHLRDSNIYVLGQIGEHNIVITCLPERGTVKAAEVATMMLSSFPLIRFGLMVGIGGAIPNQSIDIRLGDIVISRPEGTDPGVIQYDTGKEIQGKSFQRKGILTKPPVLLLNAAKYLESEYGLEKQLVKDLNNGFMKWFPDWASERLYPGAEFDNLFAAEYGHISGSTCDTCDKSKMVVRNQRKNIYPFIHYGNIASGNKVIKDAKVRDELGRNENVICFEMEAAGLMDSLRCLVIRGISDYSDTHKNDRWQPYAAGVAAAYAKRLLYILPQQSVQMMERMEARQSKEAVYVC